VARSISDSVKAFITDAIGLTTLHLKHCRDTKSLARVGCTHPDPQPHSPTLDLESAGWPRSAFPNWGTSK